MGGVAGECRDLADEVRAAGTRRDLHALDGEVGVRVEELRQDARHLDPRCMPLQLDARGDTTLDVREDFALELRMRGSGFEVGEQVGHVRSALVSPQYYYKRFRSEGLAC
jgi:hypothetical protein